MSNKKIYFIVFILLAGLFINSKIVFADNPTGASAWTVKLFAGPGKGDEAVGTVTSSDGVTGGPNKIYALGSRYVPPNERERIIYEFIWTGDSWSKTETAVPSATYFDVPRNSGFYDLRREGRKRLYFSTWHGAVFEYSYNGTAWHMDSYLPNSEETEVLLYGFAVGSRGANDNLKLYRSSGNNQLEEYEWNGTTWAMINAQNIYMFGNNFYTIDSLAFGNARNNDKNYLYFLGATSSFPLSELEWVATTWQEDDGNGGVTWKGPGWKESSRMNVEAYTTFGRPQLFTTDAGNGLKLYFIGGVHVNNVWTAAVYECEWDNAQNIWKRTQKVSIVDKNCHITAITYGKISWEDTDPVAIYVLVSYYADNADPDQNKYSMNLADEIHEYTFDKSANKGKGAWTRTWKAKLYEENLQEIDSARGFPCTDFCMTNGRNEIIITPDGKMVDKYQRLYVVDTWGNIWECSIPPRNVRPDYKAEVVPGKKPTITGE